MPITPETREGLAASIGRLVRIGRHLSAGQLYGDLPSYGWSLLLPLQRDGDQRCSALAACAGIDVSVASRQLAGLERSGYVERRPDPLDGRASLLRLTPAGAAALEEARALRSGWALTALSGWDEDDASLLTALLDRLASDLESAGSLPGPAHPPPTADFPPIDQHRRRNP